MKKLLFIALAVFCLVSITSCSSDSIEDIQEQEEIQKELEQIDIYAREGEPDEDGTIDDIDPDDDGEG